MLDIEAFAWKSMEVRGLAAGLFHSIVQNHAYSYLEEGAFSARRMTTGQCRSMQFLGRDACHLYGLLDAKVK